MMLSKLAKRIDGWFIRRAGVPYLLLTRDWMINQRMDYLVRWIQQRAENVRVLDVGCGAALALVHMQERCAGKIAKYVGVDSYTDRLAVRYAFIDIPHEFVTLDLDSNWELGSFDVVFCSEVIEHILDDERLFSRLCSHLDTGGLLLMTMPRKSFIRRWARTFPGLDAVSARQDGGHVRVGYDPEELATLALKHGFKRIEQRGLGQMTARQVGRRRALMRNGEYVNTSRFNIGWLLGSRESTDINNAQCWTLAMAFERELDCSASESMPAAAQGGR
jgi:SAM-dependent methyltransferase